MNEVPDSVPNPNPENPAEETVSCAGVARETIDLLSSAVQKGREHATKSARDLKPRIAGATRKAAYNSAYALAYGVCFGAAVAKAVFPRVLKDGVSEGADAGRRAADGFCTRSAQTPPPPVAAPMPEGL